MKHSPFRIVSLAAAIVALGIPARAISINDPGVVGTVKSGEPSSVGNEVIFVNTLLGMGASDTATLTAATLGLTGGAPTDTYLFNTSSTNYNGSVSAVGVLNSVANPTGSQLQVSGYDYVLGKYDGPNGGDVVWFLGGAAFVLPSDSTGLWMNPAGKGFGISHWAAFNLHGVPDGGATAALLALGLIGFAALRGRLVRR